MSKDYADFFKTQPIEYNRFDLTNPDGTTVYDRFGAVQLDTEKLIDRFSGVKISEIDLLRWLNNLRNLFSTVSSEEQIRLLNETQRIDAEGNRVILYQDLLALKTVLETTDFTGPQGSPGDPTILLEILGEVAFKDIAEMTYVHEQLIPAAVWEISHPLQKYPSVSVVDSAGSLFVGDVVYKDNANVQLTFVSAFAGKAYLN